MKLHRVGVLVLVPVAVAVAIVGLVGATGRPSSPPVDRVERGRYLTQIGGCNDCHTPGTFYGSPDMERQFSGSELGWVGPWGVTFPRNLTPDPETGIGRWSEQDIVRAIRNGIRPDGSPILPPMPWPYYASLTDEDAFAIAAYLKTLKPVHHRAPDRLPPGIAYEGPALRFPAPPAWDAPRAAGAPVGTNTGAGN